jgi:hypothetical protein
MQRRLFPILRNCKKIFGKISNRNLQLLFSAEPHAFTYPGHKRIRSPQIHARHFAGLCRLFPEEYNAVGFVFQNRYKSLFIDKESYLLECARYIERNPLRAKLTLDLFNYPWSSFSYYVSGIENGIIKRANPFYMKLAASEEERRKQFHKFVLEERPYDQIVDDFFKLR